MVDSVRAAILSSTRFHVRRNRIRNAYNVMVHLYLPSRGRRLGRDESVDPGSERTHHFIRWVARLGFISGPILARFH